MPPSKELFDEIYREKVRHSRSLTGAQRVQMSFDLTEAVLEMMAAGVRRQFPNADEQEVQRIVCERVDIQRRLNVRR